MVKRPTVRRFFLTIACVIATPSAIVAQTPNRRALTADEVVTAVVRRAPLEDVIAGDVEVEAGRARVTGAYPNPQIIYMREQTYGSAGTGEDYLSLSQTIDLGNRRGLQRRAGRTRAEAARADGDRMRLDVAADAQLRFYELLYRQRRVASLEAWVAEVERALDVVRRREAGGDAAPYDRRRLEREQISASGRLETERASLERAEARLGALLGTRTPLITGTLLPPEDPDALNELRAASNQRPDIRALELRVLASGLLRTAASRWWAPDLRLEAGWKGVALSPQGRTDGFLLGASLSIPLWDQSAGLARAAEGETRAALGRLALIESELEGELAGAHAEAVRLRRAAEALESQSSAATSDLVRIATAGYEGGELGLLELLDAYRCAADDALAALDVAFAARRARIELDRMTGAALP